MANITTFSQRCYRKSVSLVLLHFLCLEVAFFLAVNGGTITEPQQRKMLGETNNHPPQAVDEEEQSFWKAMDEFLHKHHHHSEIKDKEKNAEQVEEAANEVDSGGTVVEDPQPVDTEFHHHPYMQAIFEEIESEKHRKWSLMKMPGAMIRGIEPIKVELNRGPEEAILDFDVTMIQNLVHVHHVDLVLPSTDDDHRHAVNASLELFEVELGHNQDGEGGTRKMVSVSDWLTTTPKQSTSDRRSYLVLEIMPILERWWKTGSHLLLVHQNKLRLRLTRSDGKLLSFVRPLLVFYYESSVEEARRLDSRLMNTAKRLQLHARATRRAHMPPRPCKHGCAYAERKKPLAKTLEQDDTCRFHKWYVTLQELQWDEHVVAPYGFHMNYCSGPCKVPLVDSMNNTNHAVFRSQMLLADKLSDSLVNIPPPYCVPISLKSAHFMYTENDTLVLRPLENAVAEQCGCR